MYNQYYVYTPLHVAGQIKNKEHAEPKEESCSTRRAWLHAAMPLALLLGIMESLVTAKVDVGQVTHCSWSSQCNRLLPVIHICGGQEQHDSLVSRPFSIPFQCAKWRGEA